MFNEITMSEKEDYTPYGEEWKKEMSRLPKAVIIEVASKIGTERDLFRDQRNELYHALQAIVDNIDNWLETGTPATPELSEMLYNAAKKAVTRAEQG